jgi:hypothetical protein
MATYVKSLVISAGKIVSGTNGNPAPGDMSLSGPGFIGRTAAGAGSGVVVTLGNGVQFSAGALTLNIGAGLAFSGSQLICTVSPGTGTVTDVTGTAPIHSSGGTAPDISFDWGDVVAADLPDLSGIYSVLGHTHTFASLTGKPTTMSGYGIADAQPLDADLTAIAALTVTGGWAKRTAANTWIIATPNATEVGAVSSLANQVTNTILAGPATGANAAPTFRVLVAADIPNLDTGKVTTGTFSTARLGSGTANSGKVLLGDSTWGTYFTGTVTSVDLSLPAEFTISGNPVTTAGTLTGVWATQSANKVFAGPTTGSAATPTFRLLVAADLPNHSTALLTTGTLPAARGGTGLNTFVIGDMLYADSTASMATIGSNTSATRKFLLQTGSGTVASPPSWSALVAADIPDISATYSAVGHTHTFASLTSKPTTLSGYGITDAQAQDADLDAIAALTATSSTAWLRRTAANTWSFSTPTASDVGAAALVHTHSAADITSGTLGVVFGGTGLADAGVAYSLLRSTGHFKAMVAVGPNVTTTTMYLTCKGDNTNANTMGWQAIQTSDISGLAVTWSAAQTFLNSSGIKIQDTDASHTLGIVGGSNLTANRTLTITTGDASRTLTFTADATIGGTTSGTNTGDQTAGSGLTGTTTLSIASNGVTDAMLRQGGATSVIGRSANSTGNVADVSASADGQILARDGGALGFSAMTPTIMAPVMLVDSIAQTTVASTTPVNLQSVPVNVGEKWVITYMLDITGATNGVKFSVTSPLNTTLRLSVMAPTTGITVLSAGENLATTTGDTITTTTAYFSAAFTGLAIVRLTVSVVNTAGNVVLRIQTGSGTNTITVLTASSYTALRGT